MNVRRGWSVLALVVMMAMWAIPAPGAHANHGSELEATCSDGIDNDNGGGTDSADAECYTDSGDGVEDGFASCYHADEFRVASQRVSNESIESTSDGRAVAPSDGQNEDDVLTELIHDYVELVGWKARLIPLVFLEQNMHNANCIVAANSSLE